MTMITRRDAVLRTVFGAGYVGLRALATGLPASLLMSPRQLLAGRLSLRRSAPGCHNYQHRQPGEQAAGSNAAQRSLWHVVTLSVGSYQQGGFGAHPTWAAHYEQRWSLSDHSELNAGIARSEHPYDGNPESRTSVTVNYEGRF